MLRCQVAADKWDLGGLEFCPHYPPPPLHLPNPRRELYTVLRCSVGSRRIWKSNVE